MNSTSDLSLLSEQAVGYWRNHLFVQAAATAWFFYDYLLTFFDEIRCIWRQRFSLLKLVFLVIRYSALANTLRAVESFGRWDLLPGGGALECQIVRRLDTATGSIFYASFATLMALRVHAISGRNIKASLPVFCLGMIFVCCNGFLHSIGTISPRPFSSGCQQSFVLGGQFGEMFGNRTYANAMYGIIGITGMSSIFIAEAIVQAYTWRYTWSVIRGLGKVRTQKSLSFFVLRDGTIAWLIIAIWTIVSEAITSVDLSPITIPCMSITLCRALMRLRQVEFSRGIDGTSSVKSGITADFAGHVGTLVDLPERRGRHQDEEEDEHVESTAYARSNLPAVDLEVPQVVDGSTVERC